MSDTAIHYLLLYDYVEDIRERRSPFRDEHLARIKVERDAGRVLMAGALGDPPLGAAIVFRGVDRNAVEEFARHDPYMTAGLVPRWHVERWFLV